MPVRFDADGEDYSRTISLGAQSAFSVSIWAKISVDRNTFVTPWSLALSTSNYCLLQTGSDGTSMALWETNAGSSIGSRAMTVGTWYWWGISHASGEIIVKSRSATDTAFTTSTTASSGNVTLTTLQIGESIFTGEWLNGSVAGFKFWTATLTAAELENEFLTLTPQRVTSLHTWQPFVIPGTADWSGNGNTLSGGSGAAVDNDGPPAVWSRAVPLVYLPSVSTVTGTLDGTLPAVTGSFTGAVEVSGTMAGVLPAVTGSFTGAVEVSGSLTGTLPAVTGSFTGEVEVSGTMAGVLPAVTGSFTGQVVEPAVSGTLDGTLPAVTGSFDGISRVPGIDVTLAGPGIQPVTLTGGAKERVATGAAAERVATGVAVTAITLTGPAIRTITTTGPGKERVSTGPAKERATTGAGV